MLCPSLYIPQDGHQIREHSLEEVDALVSWTYTFWVSPRYLVVQEIRNSRRPFFVRELRVVVTASLCRATKWNSYKCVYLLLKFCKEFTRVLTVKCGTCAKRISIRISNYVNPIMINFILLNFWGNCGNYMATPKLPKLIFNFFSTISIVLWDFH